MPTGFSKSTSRAGRETTAERIARLQYLAREQAFVLAQSPTNPDRRTALTLTDFDDSLATAEVMFTDEVNLDEIWARPWAAAKAVVAILALLALYLGLAAASSHRPAADTVDRTAALSLRASGGLLASWGAPVIGGKSR